MYTEKRRTRVQRIYVISMHARGVVVVVGGGCVCSQKVAEVTFVVCLKV